MHSRCLPARLDVACLGTSVTNRHQAAPTVHRLGRAIAAARIALDDSDWSCDVALRVHCPSAARCASDRVHRMRLRHYVAASGVPVLVVDYRIAPEHPHPAPVEDCYTALLWLAEHTAGLQIDPAPVAVMGDSAGGGLAAAVCLLARDRYGPPIAQQLLIHPMFDDRTPRPPPDLAPCLASSFDDNCTGWAALLGPAWWQRGQRLCRPGPGCRPLRLAPAPRRGGR